MRSHMLFVLLLLLCAVAISTAESTWDSLNAPDIAINRLTKAFELSRSTWETDLFKLIHGQNSEFESYGSGYNWPKFEMNFAVKLASVLGFFAAAFASAGGIGGGPLFVPLFNLLLGYDAKTSTALSKAMVFGVAISSLFFNFGRRCPFDENKTLIDYDIALLLQPALLAGISAGVICNVIFPSWLLKLLLCSLLFFSTYKTVKKGSSTWKKETSDEINSCGVFSSNGGTQLEKTKIPIFKIVKWGNIAILSLVWLVYFFIQIGNVTVKRCSLVFWILTFSQIFVSGIFCFFAAQNFLRKAEAPELESLLAQGEVQLTVKEVEIAPIVTFIAGTVAGLLGVGGGLVMGPLFLEIGIHPQVATATSAFMILFSSSMSVIEFFLIGRLPVDAAIFFCLVSVVAAFFGNSVVSALVKKTKKTSIVIFALAFFVGISSLIILTLGGEKVYIDWTQGAEMGFTKYC